MTKIEPLTLLQALNVLLAGYFKGKKGETLVRRQQYLLEDGASGEQSNTKVPLYLGLWRGMKVYMTMVFYEDKRATATCPRCRVMTNAPEGVTIQWYVAIRALGWPMPLMQ